MGVEVRFFWAEEAKPDAIDIDLPRQLPDLKFGPPESRSDEYICLPNARLGVKYVRPKQHHPAVAKSATSDPRLLSLRLSLSLSLSSLSPQKRGTNRKLELKHCTELAGRPEVWVKEVFRTEAELQQRLAKLPYEPVIRQPLSQFPTLTVHKTRWHAPFHGTMLEHAKVMLSEEVAEQLGVPMCWHSVALEAGSPETVDRALEALLAAVPALENRDGVQLAGYPAWLLAVTSSLKR